MLSYLIFNSPILQMWKPHFRDVKEPGCTASRVVRQICLKLVFFLIQLHLEEVYLISTACNAMCEPIATVQMSQK